MDCSKTWDLIHKNDHTQHKPGLTHANINIECFKSLQNQSHISFYEEDTGYMEDIPAGAQTIAHLRQQALLRMSTVICLNKSSPKDRTYNRRPRGKDTKFRNCFYTLK